MGQVNPANFVDPSGKILPQLIAGLVGAVVSGGIAYATSDGDFGAVIGGAIGGFATGALAASGIPPHAAGLIGGAIGGGISGAIKGYQRDGIEGAIKQGAMGAVLGGASGAAFGWGAGKVFGYVRPEKFWLKISYSKALKIAAKQLPTKLATGVASGLVGLYGALTGYAKKATDLIPSVEDNPGGTSGGPDSKGGGDNGGGGEEGVYRQGDIVPAPEREVLSADDPLNQLLGDPRTYLSTEAEYREAIQKRNCPTRK